MKNEEVHVTSYQSHSIVLIALLALTFISVFIAGFHFGALTVAVALLIASIKVATVILNFMHVKFESLFLKLAIAGVFVLYALVIIITFIDYLLR
ncbi:MAG: cytochrome C oxidase subunit IV family protein [Bacteroidales bacterium]|jgi:cytochrome c oxidase subunit 4|nr:cytochrome C oxidase subunit IV family protein [Bacteroidales bacterium]MCU0408255.1 cytochrome C oxidase subunit IV family protein [Bacteroidales bacterium]